MNMLKKIFNRWSALFLLAFLSGTTHAVVINFDDLTLIPSDPEFPCFCDHPLTNEYESLGLIIDGGFLGEYGEEYDHVVSGPNFLLGSDTLQLSFVGQLPTFVSMFVSSVREEVIFLKAYGVGGLVDEQQTDGWGGPHNDTPYTPNQLITLASSQGISSIVINGFYNMRTSAVIDDLTFEYANVPGPSPFLLLVSGLLVLGWRKLR